MRNALVTHVHGKWHALRTLVRMCSFLTNWREVWTSYKHSAPIPPLVFRRGFTLFHGPHDQPIMLLKEVFADRCYRKYLDSLRDGVLVDIGANIGSVTLDLVSQIEGLKAYAYEPNPSTYRTLVRNIEENGLASRVRTFGEAVGKGRSTLKLWTDIPSSWSTAYSNAAPAYDKPEMVKDAKEVEVPCIGLGEVLARVDGAISLLKIDAEGAEADILEGVEPGALSRVKNVALEYHEHLCPNALARCRDALTRAGFTCAHETFPRSINGILYAWR